MACASLSTIAICRVLITDRFRIAIGTDHGLAIVDIAQHILVWSWTTPEMYGTSDPYMRQTAAEHSERQQRQRSRAHIAVPGH
jgi:hypothetical protein